MQWDRPAPAQHSPAAPAAPPPSRCSAWPPAWPPARPPPLPAPPQWGCSFIAGGGGAVGPRCALRGCLFPPPPPSGAFFPWEPTAEVGLRPLIPSPLLRPAAVRGAKANPPAGLQPHSSAEQPRRGAAEALWLRAAGGQWVLEVGAAPGGGGRRAARTAGVAGGRRALPAPLLARFAPGAAASVASLSHPPLAPPSTPPAPPGAPPVSSAVPRTARGPPVPPAPLWGRGSVGCSGSPRAATFPWGPCGAPPPRCDPLWGPPSLLALPPPPPLGMFGVIRPTAEGRGGGGGVPTRPPEVTRGPHALHGDISTHEHRGCAPPTPQHGTRGPLLGAVGAVPAPHPRMFPPPPKEDVPGAKGQRWHSDTAFILHIPTPTPCAPCGVGGSDGTAGLWGCRDVPIRPRIWGRCCRGC